MPSARALPWLALFAVALALSVFGCSTTDSAAAVAPAGPPVLEVKGLSPAGWPETLPSDAKSCVSLGRDANETLTVVLVGDPKHPGPPPASDLGTIKNWSLEPPFECIGTPQCGYVLVTVDPGKSGGFTVASVAISVDIPLARLADPLGDHTLVVELRNSDGTRAKDVNGKPYQVILPIRVAPTCGEAVVDAGVDGSHPSLPEDGGSGDARTVPAPDGSVRDGAVSLDAGAHADASRATDASSPDAGVSPADSGPHDQ